MDQQNQNSSGASSYDQQMRPLSGSDELLQWHVPTDLPFRLSGFPFFEQDQVYRRMPLNPQAKLPEAVDFLANHTAGGQISFQSNTRHLAVKVILTGPADMPHMPSTGQCGFDLYIGSADTQRFHNTTKYDQKESAYEILLFEHTKTERRHFTLNFPLYQGVKKIEIGLTPKAEIAQPLAYSTEGPILIYGTSITQGGCATRPGMAYSNILSRIFNAEMINLGFSGSGKGEIEVAQSIALIENPRLFILDFEANQTSEEHLKTLPPFIQHLREKHPLTSILVLSRPSFARDILYPEKVLDREHCCAQKAEIVKAMAREGDEHIHFLDGSTLQGDDFDECTIDGAHPSDLGFYRMAKNLEPVVRQILSNT
jgi:lysophospholipase L1-like esterase